MPLKRLFLRINKDISLHLPYPALAETMFTIVDTQRTHLGKWLPWVAETKVLIDTERFLNSAMRVNAARQQLVTFIAFQNEFAGSVSFTEIKEFHRKGEMGYWLREDLQGKGIITAACKGFIRYGFEQLNLNRIAIQVDSSNFKSRAIPLRLGFMHEGTFHQSIFYNGKFRDVEMYALLKNQWLNK